jgi:hypothetical protein
MGILHAALHWNLGGRGVAMRSLMFRLLTLGLECMQAPVAATASVFFWAFNAFE